LKHKRRERKTSRGGEGKRQRDRAQEKPVDRDFIEMRVRFQQRDVDRIFHNFLFFGSEPSWK
jgi:hypothetical protein